MSLSESTNKWIKKVLYDGYETIRPNEMENELIDEVKKEKKNES